MKRSKLPRCSGAREDRLSSLPDDILINYILPLLPFREAHRTSILARRWRYLWSYLPGLDLDGSLKVLPFDERTHGKSVKADELDMLGASKYAEWVDRVVHAYRGTATLTHFRLLFRMNGFITHKINSWLEFSSRQGVEVLELDCCDTGGRKYLPYEFPSFEPTLFPNIRLLKSLTLKAVDISGAKLERLLLACEFLETLHLAGLYNLIHFNVTGPVSRLKHIEIDTGRQSITLFSITIRAPTPDLVSFRYPHYLKDVHIEHAPRLIDLGMINPLHVSDNITAYPLFRYLSQLEALHLVVLRERDIVKLPGFPVLSRLKHLKLDFGPPGYYVGGPELLRENLRFFASAIEIAPCLQHLTLEVHRLNSRLKLREGLAGLHLQLPPVVEIAGFKGRRVDCELALHLIKAGRPLEKLIIDCRDPLRRGYMLGRYEYPERIIKKGRKAAKEVIGPELPPSKAKLVII